MDLRITPIPSPAGVTLLLNGGGLPAAGKRVNRTNPQIDRGLLERFRRTRLDHAETQQLSDAVTQWLFDNDLRPVFDNLLPGNGNPVRVVFVVPNDARAIFAELPLELLWHDQPDKPLVLRNDVQTIAYLLDKAQAPMRAPNTLNWPFKVLMVRASPPDLDAVPPVAALAEKIRHLGAHYGQGMVEVDVISVEAGKPATWTGLQSHLRQTHDYNVLVYLGHGELVPSATGGDPIGHIFMESEDGGGHVPVSAPQLAHLLTKYPIGVVVLAGCLTGDDPASKARMHGGEQGVAQALVNSSESGVEIAIAMRTELNAKAADTFLEAFFQSLLDTSPVPNGRLRAGDVECAVRHARSALFLDSPDPPQWAAPVMLRASEREPYIDYLAQPVKFKVTDKMKAALELRSILWTNAADYSLAAGLPPGMDKTAKTLDEVRKMFLSDALLQGPVLLPRDVTAGAGQQGNVVFELLGPLSIVQLRARVTVAPGVTVTRISVPPGVAAGFDLMIHATEQGTFELRAKSNAPTALAAGDLVQVEVQVAANIAPGIHGVGIEIQKMDRPGPLWPGDAVVIVPRP